MLITLAILNERLDVVIVETTSKAHWNGFYLEGTARGLLMEVESKSVRSKSLSVSRKPLPRDALSCFKRSRTSSSRVTVVLMLN